MQGEGPSLGTGGAWELGEREGRQGECLLHPPGGRGGSVLPGSLVTQMDKGSPGQFVLVIWGGISPVCVSLA